eukprot:6209041-Pleurochrysis_carterae.AAC.2
MAGEQHAQREASREDETLAEVEPRERVLRAQRGRLVLAERLVVAPRLVLARVEVLDRLVVEERVGEALRRRIVRLVLRLADRSAPLGHGEGVGRVQAQRRHGRQRKGEAARVGEEGGHDTHFEGGWQHVQHRGGEQRPNCLGATFHRTSERPRPSIQVEMKLKAEQVAERVRAHLTEGTLRDGGKERVAQLCQAVRPNASCPISDHKQRGCGHQPIRVAQQVRVRQAVDSILEEEGDLGTRLQ